MTSDREEKRQLWFVFSNHDVLLHRLPDGTFTIPEGDASPMPVPDGANVISIPSTASGHPATLHTYNTAAPLPDDEQYEPCDLRASYYKLPFELYLRAGKCHELLHWDKSSRYCGCCGAPMVMSSPISKKCSKCGKEVWPMLATAIIVLISRGDEVLLVHAKHFKKPFYGLVAGFVETGETLEEAVIREVREETSLTIRNIRYYASQPWPYPCGLMVGFYADYESGEVSLQESELAYGGWFNRHALPTIPEKLSLARMLIDNWLNSFSDQ